MNRLCYRIVFNRARGLLMAVAETVSPAGKGGLPQSRPSASRARLAVTLNRLVWATWLALAGPCSAAGSIVADPNAPANQRPSITNTANGLPQVNIQTPSAAGVSRNQYQQFDVNKAGAILNNATTNTNTQLGGWIQGNPNLSGGSARIILNEVNSNRPSQLRGFLEVAGGRAQVVVANAAGIVCDGCGTINAGRMTLTTGRPQFGLDGSLSGYQVERGLISIEGAGWLSQSTEYADIIARAVQVNAGIWAQNAQVIAGNNLVSADLQQITPLSNNEPAPAAFAIDVAQLGGMYAGKIRLVATEAGVGVRNSGQLNANNGTLSLNSAGQLTLSGNQYSAQALSLQADGDIQHQGTSYSAGQLTLQSEGAIQNSGTLAAQDKLSLQAANLQSSGALAAGSNTQGQITSNGQLSLTVQDTLQLNGQLLAGGAAQLSANTLDLSTSQLASQSSLSLKAEQAINLQQASLYSPLLTIQSAGQLNTDQATLQAGNWQVNVGSLSNQQGLWQQWSNGPSTLTVQQTLNNQAGRIQATDLTLNAGLLNNLDGLISSQGQLALQAQQLDNQQGRLLSAGQITLSADQLNNQQGQIHSDKGLSLQLNGLLNNRDGSLLSLGNIQLAASQLDNQGGKLHSTGTLQATLSGSLNNQQGQLIAERDQQLQASTLHNQQGKISSGQALKVNAQQLSNTAGSLHGQNRLALTLQQDYTVSQGETLSSQGELRFTTSGTLRNDSQWHNAGSLTLTAQSVSNSQHASLASGQRLTINSATTLNNLGRLDGDQVSLTADILDNQGMISGGQAQLNGRIIDNHGSQAVIAATDSLSLSARERLTNRDNGYIYSANTLSLYSDDLIENISTTIEAEGDISVQAQRLDNRRTHVDIQREAEQTRYSWNKYNYYWRSLGMWVNTDRNSVAPTTKTLLVNNAEAAKSQYGTIIGEPNLANNTVRIRYKGNKEVTVNYQAIQKNADGSYNLTFYEAKGGGIGGGFNPSASPRPYVHTVWREFNRGRNEVWDPNIHVSGYDLDNITDYNNFRERSVTGVISVDKFISAGQTASLHSGGNLTLNIGQRLLNDASRLTANGSLNLQGNGQVINQAYSVNLREQETTVDHYDRDTVHWYPTHYTDKTTALQTLDSVIAGNQGVSINAPSISNLTIQSAQSPSATRPDPLSGSPEQPGLLAQLPNNGLFTQNPDPQAGYLIETDARFTQYGNFISSDYMLDRLGLNPAGTHKRLGDGYYEQKIVREQLLALTGRASAQGQSAMAEYQALMNNALAVAQDFHLSTGVALTPAQIAALQQDIVWLVSETVQTANGPQTVLVPKVYLATNTVSLTGDGAVIAGKDLSLSAQSLNNSGHLNASGTLIAQADTLLHTGGLMQGSQVSLQAKQLTLSTDLQNLGRQAEVAGDNLQLSGQDVTLQGAKLSAEQNLSLSASNNLTISTARSSYEGSVDVIAGRMGNRDTSLSSDDSSSGIGIAGRMGNRDTNLSGDVGGSGVAHITGRWENALGSDLNAKGNLTLSAGQDLKLIGSSAQAQGLTTAQAGGNIHIQADTTTDRSTLSADSASSSVNASRQADTLHASQLGGGAGLLVIADQDLTVQGSALFSDQGQVLLSGQQVTLGTTLSHTQDHDSESFQGWQQTDSSSTQVLGSFVSGQQGVTIQAREQDLTVQASTLQSEQGAIVLSAAQDVNIIADYASEDFERHSQRNSKKLFSKKTTSTDQIDHQTLAQGSTLSGDSISIQAGNNLLIQGSQVAATHDVDLIAGQNVTITTATNSSSNYYDQQTRESGLLGGGGIGFTIGSRERKDQSTDTLLTHTGSTVGSILGDVNITAGKDLSVQGSDLVAGNDIDLYAQNIRITDVENRLQHNEKHEFKQSGLSVSLAGAIGAAINTAVSQAQQSSDAKDDPRMQALYGIQAGLSGYQVYQAYQQAAAQDGTGNSFGISLSIGNQKSQSQSSLNQTQSQGNQVTAGGNISLTATGSGAKDQAGYASDGNIHIKGSELQAGGDIALDAARDITLEAGKNQKTLDGSNSSSGWSVGVALTVGEKTGITISASANKGKGSEEGNGNNWNETTLKAGGDLILQSGRDTTLTGATASGETVIADVGRDLTLTSLQDEDSYHSKQQDASAGVSFTFGPSGGLSASLNLSKQKIDSDYNSIQEQTGLYAGKGGFDVTVGNHTQLNGAVIASTADPADNLLDTGTLGFGNLHNQADFKSESQSIGISTSNPAASAMSAASNLAGGNNSGHAESTTYAAVSEGTINIRDTENQQQNVEDLSRDVEHAANGLDPIFDKEKEQKRLQQAKLIGEIGQQVMTIIRTEGQIEANKAAKEAANDPDKLKAAKTLLGDNATDQAVQELAYKTAYDEVMKGYGTGSNLQTAAQAVTAALQGLAGGNLDAALAGAAAPYLAGVIKDLTQGNPEANKFAHAVLGAVIAQLKGESALAGGVAAGAAPAIAKILQEKMYPGIQLEDLSEEQKQTISALTTLAGGLAGGLLTGEASGALTGGQAAKNEVDNNSLNSRSGKNLMHTLRSCAGHCDVKQLEKDFKEQSAQWDKVVSSRCEGAGANLLTCGHTISGLQESMTFISSAYGMAKTAEEREVLGKLYNQQVADINRAIASLSKLDASASLVEQFIAVTLPALPDLIAGAGSSKPIGSGAKPGVGSAIPVKDKVTAANGLSYQSNPKHTPGAPSNRPNAGVEPNNSLTIFGQSVPYSDGKTRYAVSSDGNLHRFMTEDGGKTWHWNGSTGQGKNSLTQNTVPVEIKKQFNLPLKGNKKPWS